MSDNKTPRSPASVRDLETATKLKAAKDAAISALQAARSSAKDHLNTAEALQRDPSAKFMHDLAEETPPKDIKTVKAASGAKAKSAPDASSPIARAQKAAKRAKDEGDLSQAEKFEKAAADLGCDFDDEKFMGVLKKLAKAKLG